MTSAYDYKAWALETQAVVEINFLSNTLNDKIYLNIYLYTFHIMWKNIHFYCEKLWVEAKCALAIRGENNIRRAVQNL